MKFNICRTFLALLAAASFSSHSLAEEGKKECHKPEIKVSKELEQIKKLSGRWEGSSSEGPMVVLYRTTSGGSAVEETLHPGTEMEMISMYNDEKGKLTMTHYCMLGNQPKLALLNSTPQHMSLSLSPTQKSIDPRKDMHMHALDISFIDPDTIVQKWTGFQDGKENHSVIFKLKRVG